jgi:hypothetical protein
MKTWGSVGIARAFLTSALDGDEWSASWPGQNKNFQYELEGRMSGPQSLSGRCGWDRSLATAGLEPWPCGLQPIIILTDVSRFLNTQYAVKGKSGWLVTPRTSWILIIPFIQYISKYMKQRQQWNAGHQFCNCIYSHLAIRTWHILPKLRQMLELQSRISPIGVRICVPLPSRLSVWLTHSFALCFSGSAGLLYNGYAFFLLSHFSALVSNPLHLQAICEFLSSDFSTTFCLTLRHVLGPSSLSNPTHMPPAFPRLST